MKTRERIDKTDGKITRRKISLITQESMTNKQAHTPAKVCCSVAYAKWKKKKTWEKTESNF